MKKLTLFILLILLISSCSVSPDGKDEKGYYVLEKECVKSHKETHMQYYGKNVWMPKESEYCDEYKDVKRYIDYTP